MALAPLGVAVSTRRSTTRRLEDLLQQAERRGLRERIPPTGYRLDVHRLLWAMDVLAFPSQIVPLDQSIGLYQEGERLKRHCEARVYDAQARIVQIALGSDGQPGWL